MQHNSNNFKHTIVHIQAYNHKHKHEFVQPYAQCTLHHASTRTYICHAHACSQWRAPFMLSCASMHMLIECPVMP